MTIAMCGGVYQLLSARRARWRSVLAGGGVAGVVLLATPTAAGYYLRSVAGATPVALFLMLAGVLFTCYLAAFGLFLGAGVTARVELGSRQPGDLTGHHRTPATRPLITTSHEKSAKATPRSGRLRRRVNLLASWTRPRDRDPLSTERPQERRSDAGETWAGRVGKIVKGMFVALALDAALGDGTRVLEIILTILGAIFALAVGEIYGAALEAEFKLRRRLAGSEVSRLGVDTLFIVLGGIPSTVLFVLAGLGVFSSRTAADIALWSGIGLLGFLGLTADRLSGHSRGQAVLHAAELAALGAIVLLIKSLIY